MSAIERPDAGLTLPFSRVAVLGRELDGVWTFLRGVERATHAQDSHWVRSDGRRVYAMEFDASGPLRLRWQPYEAAVLVVSATRSITDELRRDWSELRARSRCPLVVYLACCDSAHAVPDVVEMELRELLDRAGYDADTVEFVRARDEAASFDTDAVDAVFSALDARAWVAPNPAEAPLIAVVTERWYDGANGLRVVQGRLDERRSWTAVQGTDALGVRARKVSTSRERDARGHGAANAWLDPQLEPESVVLDDALYTRRSRVRALAFHREITAQRARTLSMELRGALIDGRIEYIGSDVIDPRGIWVWIEWSAPHCALDGMALRFDGASAAIVCHDDRVVIE